MEAFNWNPRYLTGIESVDEQHHRLVDMTNRLGDVMLAGDELSEGKLQVLFMELSTYAREHFADEERLMAEAGLDPRHVQAHTKHHHQFVEQLAAMWRGRSAMKNSAETVHGFLAAWLAFHILGEDQVMARQIARMKDGAAAQIAYEVETTPQDPSTAALLTALHTLYHVVAEQNRDLAEANDRLRLQVAAQRE